MKTHQEEGAERTSGNLLQVLDHKKEEETNSSHESRDTKGLFTRSHEILKSINQGMQNVLAF